MYTVLTTISLAMFNQKEITISSSNSQQLLSGIPNQEEMTNNHQHILNQVEMTNNHQQCFPGKSTHVYSTVLTLYLQSRRDDNQPFESTHMPRLNLTHNLNYCSSVFTSNLSIGILVSLLHQPHMTQTIQRIGPYILRTKRLNLTKLKFC